MSSNPRSNLPALWRSFSDWSSFRRAMAGMIEDSLSGVEPEPFSSWEDDSAGPTAELDEAEDRYLLTLALPDIPREKLEVQLSDRILTVSGERRLRGGVGPDRHDHFLQTIRLPQDSDPERVEAHYGDGVLRISIPKRAPVRVRAIPIQGKDKEEAA